MGPDRAQRAARVSEDKRARQLHVIGCHGCGLVCQDVLDEQRHARCPRCGSALHRRRPDSIARTWALLIAGMVFYIPANVLPVMYTNLLGSGHESTILSGVVQFWKAGSGGIALVIFIASVGVPCTKFLVLGLLLATSQRGSRWAMRERARLYRLVELIGYWSMLDVLVVAVVAALVKFQALSDIEPRVGILFFGMVVLLTMLSAMSFDPRLIWDGEKK
jgi:paraquat-inducible protein A